MQVHFSTKMIKKAKTNRNNLKKIHSVNKVKKSVTSTMVILQTFGTRKQKRDGWHQKYFYNILKYDFDSLKRMEK